MSMSITRKLFSVRSLVPERQRLGTLPRTKDAYKEMLHIALPSVIESVLISLISSMDTMMVGNVLGAEALSSVGLPTQPRMVLLAVFLALNIGITAIVARRKGEEKQGEANATLRNALVLSLLISFVLTVAAYYFAEPILQVAGGDSAESPKILEDAKTYFRIMTLSLPLSVITMCICAAQRGIGRTRITMVVNVASNLVNVFFNYCLIGGNLGFPRLEVKGAAIASVIGIAVGTLMALSTVVVGGSRKGYLHFSLKDSWRFNGRIMKSIITVGGNAAIEQVGMRFGFFMSARIIFSMGTTMYAANQIIQQLTYLTFSLGDGIAVAATSLVGQNLGKKRADLSMMYGKIGQRYSLIGSILLAVFLITLRYQIAGLYIGADTLNADLVVAYAAAAMVVQALMQPFQTSAVVLAGSLRGAGDNLYVALVVTLCVGIFRPLVCFVTVNVLHASLSIVWLGMMMEFVLRAAFFFPRFAGDKWKTKKV